MPWWGFTEAVSLVVRGVLDFKEQGWAGTNLPEANRVELDHGQAEEPLWTSQGILEAGNRAGPRDPELSTVLSFCFYTVTEWLVGEHRAHAVFLEHCFFSVGIIFLTGLAYYLPHWRLLFLVGGVPVFSFISYIW